MEQRFVVNGINNDKIELVSKYDVRKLNRLLDAKDKMWLVKIKKAREEMDKLASHKVRPISFDQSVAIDMCIGILDKLIEESED
jgi:hypothetical protein